jgi:hypothetical protein
LLCVSCLSPIVHAAVCLCSTGKSHSHSFLLAPPALQSAFVGAMAIAELVKTTLGPKGMVRRWAGGPKGPACVCSWGETAPTTTAACSTPNPWAVALTQQQHCQQYVVCSSSKLVKQAGHVRGHLPQRSLASCANRTIAFCCRGSVSVYVACVYVHACVYT